ncbi:Golgi transport complex subunit 6 [Agyrium rufum]|nr:Golgi transport complex subunit 6 [Agyrium rufum]
MSGLDVSIPSTPGIDDVSSFITSPHPQKSSALSNRLGSILSASYADGETRDALKILDERQLTNSAEARRNLRLDIQREVISCNGDIIKDFGQVAKQLRRIGSTIENLNRCCQDMRSHIQAANREVAPIVEEAAPLFAQQREVEVKRKLHDAFKAHFIIPEEELTALTSMSVPVDDQFFLTLTRLKRIHADCQILLGSENQQLGLDLMDRSSRSLNSAYQKLFRWIQREFRTLNLENPQIGASIRRSLRVLAERPSLFQSCLDFFAEAREQSLSDSFYHALTGSGPNQALDQSAKPIEYYAHDPLRFVGDMLAWTHSATVSEREALEVLFVGEGSEMAAGIQAGLASEPWLRGSEGEVEVFNGEKSLRQLVNRDFIGVARILRQRIEQVIHSDEDPVLAYKIANLIEFYRATFVRHLGAESSLLAMLSGLREMALAQYRSTMRERVTSIKNEMAHLSAPPNLDIPDFLDESLTQLHELMKSYGSALSPQESREAEFQPILAEALDPVLEICESLAAKLEEPLSSIFTINCLTSAKSTLSRYAEFTKERREEIDDTVEEYFDKLVEYQHAYFLHTSGLYPYISDLASMSIESVADARRVLKLPTFSEKIIRSVSQTLDNFLPSALMDAQENVKELKSKVLASEVTAGGAARFCEDFELLESWFIRVDEVRLDDERDESEDEDDADEVRAPLLRDLFPRTSGEIRVLLS